MRTAKVHEIAAALPDFGELRPAMQRILFESLPDPEGGWTASGELGTLGERDVPAGALAGAAEELADDVRAHLVGLYGCVGRVVRALAEDEPAEAARALLEAGALEEDAGRPDRAEGYVRRALGLAPAPDDDGGLRARCARRLARVLRRQGRLEESAGLYEEAWELARARGHDRDTAVAAIGRGNVAVDHGRWEEAEAWYRRALERLEVMEVGAEHWHVQVNLAIVARNRGELDACRAHLEKAGSVAALVEPGAEPPLLTHARGMLKMVSGEAAEAAELFREGLLAVEGSEARVRMSVNLGECLLTMGEVPEAGEMARRAEWIALEEDLVRRLPEVYRLLGKVATREGDPDTAALFFEHALKLIHGRGLPDVERARTLEAYAELDEAEALDISVRSRLETAARLYADIGDSVAEERVRARLRESGGR